MKTIDDHRIEHEEAELLLPWHVTGRLNELDARRMQRHLAECAHCSAEAAAQQGIRSSMCSAPAVEYTPQASLSKLMERIDAREQRRTKWRSRLSWMLPGSPLVPRSSARAWIRTLTIATGVQALAIVVLLAAVGWFAFDSAPSSDYRTLTSAAEEAPAGGSAVRVVFDESLRIEEMQSLLRSIDGRIVSGPTAAGAYTIHVGAGSVQDAPELAQWLRAQPGVRLAEPVVRRE
jgi:anti-sigma factor RsiW